MFTGKLIKSREKSFQTSTSAEWSRTIVTARYTVLHEEAADFTALIGAVRVKVYFTNRTSRDSVGNCTGAAITNSNTAINTTQHIGRWDKAIEASRTGDVIGTIH